MFLALMRKPWCALFMSLSGGMLHLGERGGCRTSGRCVRPSCRAGVRCARASTGRCFLIAGEEVLVFQLRGR